LYVGEFGWLTASVLGAFLVASWGAVIRRGRDVDEVQGSRWGRSRKTAAPRVVRLDDASPATEREAIELTTAYDGSSALITIVGSMGRPEADALATHLTDIVAGGFERVVVDVERARPAARIVEALSVASPELERHGARLALVPPKGEMLSASIQLTANGLGGWISVYDSVGEATRAVGHTHARP
jgi:hypothetical protein